MSLINSVEKAYIIKVANASVVEKISNKDDFTHDGINIFFNEIKLGDKVIIYLGGDQNVVAWQSGLIGCGEVIKPPYDQGYDATKPNNYKIDIKPDVVLEKSVPPKATKLHKKYQELFFDHAPYIGANHFPTQAIQKIQNKDALDAIYSVLNEKKYAENKLSRNALIKDFVEWFNKAENYKISYAGLVNDKVLKSWDEMFFEGRYFDVDGINISKYLKKSAEMLKAIEGNDAWVKFNDSTSKGSPKAVLGDNNFLKYLKECVENNAYINREFDNFNCNELSNAFEKSGLKIPHELISRFTALVLTKQFIILTGLSGSGKTKIAQVFTSWIAEDPSQIAIVPVGADWTNREPLLGYPNALNSSEYIKSDSGVIDLLLEATKVENQNKPYFLILDEMNLSHVERYFADFLSLMESGEDLKLHSSDEIKDVPKTIKMPKNIFVIGTVNIDETTYMFSPKVLDRAGVIEFRVDESEMNTFLSNPVKPNLDKISGLGASMAADFVRFATEDANPYADNVALNLELIKFFKELKKVGAEFGYRTAFEINRFAGILSSIVPETEKWSVEQITDAAIIQKLLPKLHGSQRKLSAVLKTLAGLCLTDQTNAENLLEVEYDALDATQLGLIKYKLSFEKIHRMYQRAKKDGFTSFAEA